MTNNNLRRFELVHNPLRLPPARLDGAMHGGEVIEVGRLARKLNNRHSISDQRLLQIPGRHIQSAGVHSPETVRSAEMGIRMPLCPVRIDIVGWKRGKRR